MSYCVVISENLALWTWIRDFTAEQKHRAQVNAFSPSSSPLTLRANLDNFICNVLSLSIPICPQYEVLAASYLTLQCALGCWREGEKKGRSKEKNWVKKKRKRRRERQWKRERRKNRGRDEVKEGEREGGRDRQREGVYGCIAYSQLVRYISKWIHTLIGS